MPEGSRWIGAQRGHLFHTSGSRGEDDFGASGDRFAETPQPDTESRDSRTSSSGSGKESEAFFKESLQYVSHHRVTPAAKIAAISFRRGEAAFVSFPLTSTRL